MARDVRGRRLAGVAARLGPPRGDGTRAMAAESRGRSNVAGLAAVRGAFFRRLAATDHSEFAFHAGFHQRALGGNGLRSSGCYRARGSRWARRAANGPACFARDDARGVRDDSRMSGDAMACGKARKARGTGLLFHADDAFYRADVCQGFLYWPSGVTLVFRLPILSWIGRSELCHLHALVAGAIPNGMPRERVCVLYLLCAFWRSGDHVSRRRGRATFWLAGNSGRADIHCICDRAPSSSFWSRNARAKPSRIGTYYFRRVSSDVPRMEASSN